MRAPRITSYNVCYTKLLRAIQALRKYHHVLYKGALINIYTDHKSLIGLMTSQAETTPRLTRWRLNLQAYNLRWLHISGKAHGLADYLSRPPEEVLQKYAACVDGTDESIEVEEYDPFIPQDGIGFSMTVFAAEPGMPTVTEKEKEEERCFLRISHSRVLKAQKNCPRITSYNVCYTKLLRVCQVVEK